MFLHPRQVVAVLDGAPGVRDYRFVIGRVDHVDQLTCHVDHVDQLTCHVVHDGSVADEELTSALTTRIREGLRFRTEVRVVDDLGEGDGPIVDRRDWS